MSRPAGISVVRGMPAAAAVTTWLTMLSWRGFSQVSGAYLIPLAIAAVIVAGTGIWLRRLRAPAVAVIGGQVLAGAMFVSLTVSGSPIPTERRRVAMADAFSAALDSAQTYAAPIPSSAASISPLLLALGVICLLLVDALACTAGRVPLAGLAILAVYSIPVSLLLGGVPWWVFVAGAAGFLTMVYLQEEDQVSRWGRPLRGPRDDPRTIEERAGGIRTGALSIGGAATVLAVLLPVVIPTLRLGWIGTGPGSGNGEVQIENPVTDLRRDLIRGDDVPLLTVYTDQPRPSYLRISVLNRFTSEQWTPGDRDIPSDQRADGDVPTPGVESVLLAENYDYTVEVEDRFQSSWLPTMPTLRRIEAPGNWRYDRATMDFISGDEGQTTAGLRYTMRSASVRITDRLLDAAPSPTGIVDPAYTTVPEDLPAIVESLATEVTAGEGTNYGKVVALQDWFRRGGKFEYSLQRAQGNGSSALADFLDNRIGYCEQFASAMAVMARTQGIPARVAVGFLRPDPAASGASAWEFSTHDLHAWPEIYFPGYGWVRFEPTPGARSGRPPDYTRRDDPAGPDVTAPTGAGQATEDLPDRGASPSTRAETDDQAAAGGSDEGGGVGWGAAAAILGSGAVAALLLVTPRWARSRRRERRWARAADPEIAWAEISDTVIDLGLAWPDGLSPRATAAKLVDLFGEPPGKHTSDRPAHGADVAPHAVEALDRLVHRLEVARYARPLTGDDDRSLRADTETCTTALYGGAPRSARRQATWWPRSLIARRRPGLRRPAIELVRGGVVDRVG